MSKAPRRIAIWRPLAARLSDGVDRESVAGDVLSAGSVTPGYLMLSGLSAAIATLGLLLSSPAVVIGAMLLSPLMGPIILLGFAFWRADWRSTGAALVSLGAGLGIALVVAVALTWVSPLKEPTSEILARTHPNLFDLLIAVFSGLAGGYAVVRRRGETAIGVAIATALMPPIATVGFGVGVGDTAIAVGALLLFATNLIAIALAVAGVAAAYGFPVTHRKTVGGWFGQAAVVLVVVALCVPLTVSLRTIALEARVTSAVHDDVRSLFGAKARLTSLTVRSADGALEVSGLVATPRYVDGAAPKLADRLVKAFAARADVSLDQVVLADPSRLEVPPPRPPAAAKSFSPVAAPISDALRAAVPFPDTTVAYNARQRLGLVTLGQGSGLDLKAAMALEVGLRQRPGLEATEVAPPIQPLPPIPISGAGSAAARLGLGLIPEVWALRRWRADRIDAMVCGLRAGPAAWTVFRSRLRAAVAPLPSEMSAGTRSACAKASGERPFVILSPG
jgi:uncharacterized hydrophobic protein (TIGR00271 family)